MATVAGQETVDERGLPRGLKIVDITPLAKTEKASVDEPKFSIRSLSNPCHFVDLNIADPMYDTWQKFASIFASTFTPT